jgi:hypothetical protein
VRRKVLFFAFSGFVLALFAVGVSWYFFYAQENVPKNVRSFSKTRLLFGALSSPGPFCEGLARVEIGGRWGYIDKAGKFVINQQF